jgi:hypothetical protein
MRCSVRRMFVQFLRLRAFDRLESLDLFAAGFQMVRQARSDSPSGSDSPNYSDGRSARVGLEWCVSGDFWCEFWTVRTEVSDSPQGPEERFVVPIRTVCARQIGVQTFWWFCWQIPTVRP